MTTLPPTSGIYKITCTASGKFYIGSATSIAARWSAHQCFLRQGKHQNNYLQRSWNKHGADAFVCEVVELVLAPCLIEREQYYLDTLKPFGKRGFNLAPRAGSIYGIKLGPLSDAHRKAVSLSLRGKAKTKQHQQRISDSLRGKPLSLACRIAQLHAASKDWILTDPDGVEHHVRGLVTFCREHGLNDQAMRGTFEGRQEHHRGWTCRPADMLEQPTFINKSKGEYRLVDPHGNEYQTINLQAFCDEHGLYYESVKCAARDKRKMRNGWFIERLQPPYRMRDQHE